MAKMMTNNVVAAWPSLATTQFAASAVLLLFVFQVLRFLYRGVCIRIKFRRLRAQGIIIPAHHSLLLGHLPLMRELANTAPRDANDLYAMQTLVINWRVYFPGAPSCPPVIYLDLWPLFGSPILRINDPSLCQEVVADRFPPRSELSKYLARAVAGDRNLTAWDGAQHRLWRSRLNPGFSTKNLQTHVANGRIIDEVCVFVDRLRASAGPDGQWGEVFQMLPRTIDLTFDIICGVVLNFSPGEQTNGPTELQTSLRLLIRDYFKLKSLALLPKQLSPFWHLEYYRLHRKVRDITLPYIRKIVQEQSAGTKNSSAPQTVVDHALREMQKESKSWTGFETSGHGKDFVEDIVGLTKLFIFAGHDTTAVTLSFAFHFLWKNPKILGRLRDEHDQVFGTDTKRVSDLLRASPHLLSALPYTLAVVKETLRLTAAAATTRQPTKGFELRDRKTGQQYPVDDSFILISGVTTLHVHPDIWPRPTEFLPERWIVGEEDPLYPGTKYAWRPFEWGSMNCIGQELAVMEIKMALLFTVRELGFETAVQEQDRLQGKSTKDRPTVAGDPVYQMATSPLGPPTEQLPMRVRLLQ